MTACKSSGLSKPTTGCECEYCAWEKTVPIQVLKPLDVQPEAFSGVLSTRNVKLDADGHVRAWNEALAAKRAQR